MKFGKYSIAFASFVAALSLASCEKKPAPKPEEELSVPMQYKELEMKSEYYKDSKTNSTVVKYNVMTPAGYKPESGEKYCVLYLLHGYGDDNNAWLTSPQQRGGTKGIPTVMYNAVKDGIVPKTVVVMPDAKATFYMMDGFEDFFFKEFMPAVEAEYHIDSRKECRAIAGLSMGGFGSAYYGLAHPDEFCCVYTMSMANSNDMFKYYAELNKAKLPTFYVVNGDTDLTVSKQPEEFVDMMEGLGIHINYDHWAGGHDWKFWGECIPKFTEAIGTEFKKYQK